MKISHALIGTLFLWVGTSGCHPRCQDENACLLPGQCSGGPNLQRYAIPTGHYVIAQSAVGLDTCKSGRHNGDWTGLSAEMIADDAVESVALRVSNGVDLGSGSRNPQPDCNSASLTLDGVAQTVDGCTFTASFSTQLVANASSQFYLSITEHHNGLSGSCPIAETSCLVLYDATLQ